MLDMAKEHGPHILQSMFDPKTTIAAVMTTGATVTAATAEATSAFTMNDISVMAAIFAASATGIVMVLNAISTAIKIRRQLKEDDD